MSIASALGVKKPQETSTMLKYTQVHKPYKHSIEKIAAHPKSSNALFH